MINTVFVIGAGASHEINMPLGSKLKEQIAELFTWDSKEISIAAHQTPKKNIYQAIELFHTVNISRNYQKVILGDNTFRWVKTLVLAESIDNFINNHRDNDDLVTYSKIGIIQAILQAERESTMYDYITKYTFDKNPIEFKGLDNTYYVAIWKKLIEGCLYDELLERLKQITFIVFNYDRSLEYFIFHAIKEYYDIDDKEAAKAVTEINIIHPYGQIGKLDCLSENGISYGFMSTPKKIIALIPEIRTFTETVNLEDETYKKMYKFITEAERLIFLGFAYHAQNLQLLFPNGFSRNNMNYRERKYPSTRKPLEIYGTCHGLSDVDRLYVIEKLKRITNNVKIRGFFDGECRNFFYEYGLSLSFL